MMLTGDLSLPKYQKKSIKTIQTNQIKFVYLLVDGLIPVKWDTTGI